MLFLSAKIVYNDVGVEPLPIALQSLIKRVKLQWTCAGTDVDHIYSLTRAYVAVLPSLAGLSSLRIKLEFDEDLEDEALPEVARLLIIGFKTVRAHLADVPIDLEITLFEVSDYANEVVLPSFMELLAQCTVESLSLGVHGDAQFHDIASRTFQANSAFRTIGLRLRRLALTSCHALAYLPLDLDLPQVESLYIESSEQLTRTAMHGLSHRLCSLVYACGPNVRVVDLNIDFEYSHTDRAGSIPGRTRHQKAPSKKGLRSLRLTQDAMELAADALSSWNPERMRVEPYDEHGWNMIHAYVTTQGTADNLRGLCVADSKFGEEDTDLARSAASQCYRVLATAAQAESFELSIEADCCVRYGSTLDAVINRLSTVAVYVRTLRCDMSGPMHEGQHIRSRERFHLPQCQQADFRWSEDLHRNGSRNFAALLDILHAPLLQEVSMNVTSPSCEYIDHLMDAIEGGRLPALHTLSGRFSLSGHRVDLYKRSSIIWQHGIQAQRRAAFRRLCAQRQISVTALAWG